MLGKLSSAPLGIILAKNRLFLNRRLCLAYDFSEQAKNKIYEICERHYTQGSHPIENKVWRNVKLIKYQYTGKDIEFSVVNEKVNKKSKVLSRGYGKFCLQEVK